MQLTNDSGSMFAYNYRDDAGVSEPNEARKWQWNYNDNNTSPDLNYHDVMAR